MIAAGRPRESLVKYDAPLELGPASSHHGSAAQHHQNNQILEQLAHTTIMPSVDESTELREILHAVLPPREWTENAKHYIQYVSMAAATRLELIQLQEALDEKLLERQARESGICPVREELYSQIFDELIRQVAIDSPERGLLLLRIRDEARLTIAAYHTLFESAAVFGTRKQLQAEAGQEDALNTISLLEEKKKALQAQVVGLKNQCETIERREAEKKAIEDRKRKEEIEFLKHQGAHLESFLATVEKH